MAEPTQIKPGDPVTWTHVSQSRRTITMRQRKGTVESIDGELARVRLPSKAVTRISLSRLMIAGSGKTQLTQFVEAMVESSRERGGDTP